MWKEYFGENAKIYGVDIHESGRAFEDERTKVFIGDQAPKQFASGRLKLQLQKIWSCTHSLLIYE